MVVVELIPGGFGLALVWGLGFGVCWSEEKRWGRGRERMIYHVPDWYRQHPLAYVTWPVGPPATQASAEMRGSSRAVRERRVDRKCILEVFASFVDFRKLNEYQIQMDLLGNLLSDGLSRYGGFARGIENERKIGNRWDPHLLYEEEGSEPRTWT